MASRLSALLALIVIALVGAGSASASVEKPARQILDLNYNVDEVGPADVSQNSLDIYLPAVPAGGNSAPRPVVIYIHGGGLMVGDKSNRMPDKVRLFNDLGYVFVSINYRLSPVLADDLSGAFAADRVRAPDHIADVAEAIGWLSRNISSYGGDPDRIVLIGHSSGAHLAALAATSPAWLRGRQVSPRQVLGAVTLDTDTLNIRAEADPAAQGVSFSRRTKRWQTFGTPGEEAVEPRWDRVSPLLQADSTDPRFLLVTQAGRPNRIASSRAMATALGQDPDSSVFGAPYDHEGINTQLGASGDTSAMTEMVREFVRSAVESARRAGVTISRRPAKRVVLWVKRKGAPAKSGKPRRKVTFAFRGTGRATGTQCRIDGQKFRSCRSPVSYSLRPGAHTFRVRALYPSGRPGDGRKINFRIIARRSRR